MQPAEQIMYKAYDMPGMTIIAGRCFLQLLPVNLQKKLLSWARTQSGYITPPRQGRCWQKPNPATQGSHLTRVKPI